MNIINTSIAIIYVILFTILLYVETAHPQQQQQQCIKRSETTQHYYISPSPSDTRNEYSYQVCLRYQPNKYAANKKDKPNDMCILTTGADKVIVMSSIKTGWKYTLDVLAISMQGIIGETSLSSSCVIVTGDTDVNGDGITGFTDLRRVIRAYGTSHIE